MTGHNPPGTTIEERVEDKFRVLIQKFQGIKESVIFVKIFVNGSAMGEWRQFCIVFRLKVPWLCVDSHFLGRCS